MRFEAPTALAALVVVPIAVALYVAVQRRRDRDAAPFASPALLPNLVDGTPGWRRHLPPALLLLAVAAFLVGFARPHATVSEHSNAATAIVAVDASRSMGATDVAPSRLAQAQTIARRFVTGLPASYRVAVVAFGSRAQVITAPTTDHDTALAAIRALRVGEATALGDALAVAVRVAQSVAPTRTGSAGGAGRSPPAAVLVVSDGAADGGSVSLEQAVQRATRARVPVFTGVLGTPDGIVQVPHRGGYVERIQVPPDGDALRTVAQQTGGRFFGDPARDDLKAVTANLSSRELTTREDREITYAFAGGGAAVLAVGVALSALWFRRVM